MTPIERAARALCALAGDEPDALVRPSNFQSSVPREKARPMWERYIHHARVALEAIREPSEGMVAAVSDMSLMDNNPTQDWQAMIDAALAEGV